MRNPISAACVVAALTGAALAGPLPGNALDSDDMAWFYNRAGATTIELEADLRQCRGFGSAMTQPLPPEYGSGRGLLTDVINATTQAGPTVARTDDCMIARHWRRFTAPDANLAAFNARFDAMSESEKLALISSETPPEGHLARVWANDYWIAREGDPEVNMPRPPVLPTVIRGTAGRAIRPIDGRGPIVLGPHDALVVLTAAAEGERSSVVGFRRTERGDRQRLAQFDVRVETGTHTEQIFIIPAGTYSLALAGWMNAWNAAFTDFCLGTAAFTVQTGQVLYLGQLSINMDERVVVPTSPAPQFGLRVDRGELEQGRAILASTPDLASRLEYAEYENGIMQPCQAFASRIYGFDIPWARFKDDLVQ